jgi:oligopeptide transport system ATP-binding protein
MCCTRESTPVSDAQPTVQLDAVTKTFHRAGAFGRAGDTVHAVREVSLTLAQGEAVGLAGESGSGKSTIARMIVGLETPSTGRIFMRGRELARRGSVAERRANARVIQMVFQDPYSSLDPRQPVHAVLDEVQRVHFDRDPASRARHTSELLEAVGLGERYQKAIPRELSGGQRQRLAIARALAAEPAVLVLDEAVSALDVSIQAQILNLLADLRRELGLTYLFISHDLAVVRHIADRVVILYRGRVMEQGPAAATLETPRHPYSRLLLDSVPRPDMPLVQRSSHAGGVDERGCLFRHRCPHAFDACAAEPDLIATEPLHDARCWLPDRERALPAQTA